MISRYFMGLNAISLDSTGFPRTYKILKELKLFYVILIKIKEFQGFPKF